MRRKKIPIILPPGNVSKICVIATNTSDGPEDISLPVPTTVGMITNPASSAIKVSQISTHHASAFRLASLSILAPRVVKIPPSNTNRETYLHTCICELLHSEFTEIRHKIIFQSIHSSRHNDQCINTAYKK